MWHFSLVLVGLGLLPFPGTGVGCKDKETDVFCPEF